MSYQVVLPEFEGPLDLLLHLIDAHQLDIYNIPIAFITGQYMEYLKCAGEIDLNLSGEFMVMAGTLLTIKARLLLPKRLHEEAGLLMEEDPRDELVEKLLEYRLYKENALKLKELASSQARIYYRAVDDSRLLALFPAPNPVANLSIDDLEKAFRQILRSAKARSQSITLPRETLSLRQQMDRLWQTLNRQPGGVPFAGLLQEGGSVLELVTTFLALLELLHKGRVWVRQKQMFGEIYIFPQKTDAQEGEDALVHG